MEAEKPTFWFPAKRYGWGWGLPVRWQGWLVLVLYFASICAGIKYFQPWNDVAGFMIGFAIATVILSPSPPGRKAAGVALGRK